VVSCSSHINDDVGKSGANIPSTHDKSANTLIIKLTSQRVIGLVVAY